MRILFTCGGTAGHINPAIGIAGELREIMPDCEILFVGAKGNMETELVPHEGYDIKTVTITNLSRSLSPKMIVHNLKTVKNVFSAIADAKKIIREFKPDVAVGTGGYVCYPVLKAAASLKVPTIIHESNAVPGLTTKMLASVVDKILLGFAESVKYYKDASKVVVTGTPVRLGFKASDKQTAREKIGFTDSRPLVLSVWGSLGSVHMNKIMAEMIGEMDDGEFALIHATGKRAFERVKEETKGDKAVLNGEAKVYEYIYNMQETMAAADLILCRAGASTLSELGVLGKPVILIPSPNVTNNHQEKNARVLENVGAAKVMLEGEFTASSLNDEICKLLADKMALSTMSKNMANTSKGDITAKITEIVMETAKKQ